jgi:hypothetical protein
MIARVARSLFGTSGRQNCPIRWRTSTLDDGEPVNADQ